MATSHKGGENSRGLVQPLEGRGTGVLETRVRIPPYQVPDLN